MATYALTDSATTTAAIPYRDYAAGTVYVPAASSTMTTLTFHVAPKPGGTYLPLYNSSGAVVMTVAHTRAYPLPAELKGCQAFKMVANAAGNVEVTFQEPHLREV
jgi:hypothetical protein